MKNGKTVCVVSYEIRNGANGPQVFEDKALAMQNLREEFADDLTEDELKELETDGYLEFGRDCFLSVLEMPVIERG